MVFFFPIEMLLLEKLDGKRRFGSNVGTVVKELYVEDPGFEPLSDHSVMSLELEDIYSRADKSQKAA